MPTYLLSYRTPGGGPQVEFTYTAVSDKAALSSALGRAAAKARVRAPSQEETIAKFTSFFVDGRMNLVNQRTKQQFVRDFGDGAKRWQTEEGFERRIQRRRSIQEAIKKRGSFVDKGTGLILPAEPLLPRALVQSDGSPVPGSSGNAHILTIDRDKKVVTVSDVGHRLRFWPAKFDKASNSWIAQGDGEQLDNGKVTETFALKPPIVAKEFVSKTLAGEVVTLDIVAPGVKAEDIDATIATRSFGGISMSPERSAEREQRDYIRAMNNVWATLKARAETPEENDTALKEFEEFRVGYVQRKTVLLNQQSGLVSTNIAGPSNFPFARMQKKGDAIHKKEGEFFAWQEKALKRAEQAIRPSAPKFIASDNPDATGLLQGKIDKAKRDQQKFKDINAIVRGKGSDDDKVTRLVAEQGFREGQAREILKGDFANRKGIPPYMLSNNLANIKRMEARVTAIAQETERRATPAEGREFDGGTIEENTDINRLQILFDEKPGEDVRTKLKRAGFKWSRREGAWQRQLNEQARRAAAEIVGPPAITPIQTDAIQVASRGESPVKTDRPKGSFFVQFLRGGAAPSITGERIQAATMEEAKDAFRRKHSITDVQGIQATTLTSGILTPQVPRAPVVVPAAVQTREIGSGRLVWQAELQDGKGNRIPASGGGVHATEAAAFAEAEALALKPLSSAQQTVLSARKAREVKADDRPLFGPKQPTPRERIDALKASQDKRAAEIRRETPTGAQLLATRPIDLADKFLFPKGKAMERTRFQSNRLVESTLNAIEASDKVALTTSHPSVRVVDALFSSMTDAERASLLKLIPAKSLPFWESSARRSPARKAEPVNGGRLSQTGIKPGKTISIKSTADTKVRNPFDFDPTLAPSKNEALNKALGTKNLTGDALAKELASRGFDGFREVIGAVPRPQTGITREAALERFLNPLAGVSPGRKRRNPAIDTRKTAKVVAPKDATTPQQLALQAKWFKRPAQSDFQGVDTRRPRRKAMGGGRKL